MFELEARLTRALALIIYGAFWLVVGGIVGYLIGK